MSSERKPIETTKMALVVRKDLKLGKGKLAAQCAHGACKAADIARVETPYVYEKWDGGSYAKVCLCVNSLGELERLHSAALAVGLPCFLVTDEGRTQIAAGTVTMLAIGPAEKEDIDAVCGELKLF